MRCPISSPIEIQARFELRRADGELQPQKRGSQSQRQEEEFLGVGHRGSVSERSPDTPGWSLSDPAWACWLGGSATSPASMPRPLDASTTFSAKCAEVTNKD